MATAKVVGFGRFPVGEFQPGEVFMQGDGTVCQVTLEQTRHEYIELRLGLGTGRVVRTWLHRETLVHAVSSEQAHALEERARARSAAAR